MFLHVVQPVFVADGRSYCALMGKKRDCGTVASVDGEAKSALARGEHDYANNNNKSDAVVAEELQSESPPAKKRPQKHVAAAAADEGINSQLTDIMTLINNRADTIEEKISGQSDKVDAVTVDLSAVVTRAEELERRLMMIERPVRAMLKRMDEMESYTRMWNLKLTGLPESSDEEDTRAEVVKICQRVLPSMRDKLDDVVDTVHRHGNGEPAANSPRAVVVRFVSRVCRDAVLKAARTSSYLLDHDLSFQEDLVEGEKWQHLWPEKKETEKKSMEASEEGNVEEMSEERNVEEMSEEASEEMSEDVSEETSSETNMETSVADCTRHKTIQRKDTAPRIQRCNKCCRFYHCPFCSPFVFKPAKLDNIKKHIQSHCSKAVVHGDFIVHRCGLGCRPALHYHCPYCESTLLRKLDFATHLQICKKAKSTLEKNTSPASVESTTPTNDAPPTLKAEPTTPVKDASATAELTTQSTPPHQARVQPVIKLRCGVCDVLINKKNLKKHFERKHTGQSVEDKVVVDSDGDLWAFLRK